ncbi:DUF397 domain-containing protein [Actinomadura kijaniata]|uniref:DUF397 domain-containing protein n=1 Tax=Actinomadura kijaniata TaxID=46161 RepID=UPI003F1BE5A2
MSCTTWRKSSHSGGQGSACVEVASVTGMTGIRDSKDPNGSFLLVSRESARVLSERLKNS